METHSYKKHRTQLKLNPWPQQQHAAQLCELAEALDGMEEFTVILKRASTS